MRVLLITNYFAPYHVGGAEVMVHNTCLGLRRRGVDASVLMINARMPETGEQQHELQGVPVHAITYRPYTLNNPLLQTLDPRVLRNVKAEIRRLRPDLVHVHNVSGSTLAPFVACDQLGVPVVLTLHDLWLLCPNNMLYKKDGTLCDPAAHPTGCRQCFRRYDFWANIPRRREHFRHLVRNVRLIICPSQKLADLHIAAGYDRKRLHIVPNGIPPGAYRLPSDYQVRKSVMDGGRFRTVLFAGGVVEIKGIQTLLEAIPLLSKYVDRFRLIVAGTGERQYMTALQDHSPTVKLVGQVPFQEMRSLYATADLTVIPSICLENSPKVVY